MSTPFRLVIDGMHCNGCVRRVKAAIDKVPGVAVADVAIGSASGTVGDGGAVADVIAALERAGYPAHTEDAA